MQAVAGSAGSRFSPLRDQVEHRIGAPQPGVPGPPARP
jgi:hypothetical protein